MDMDMWKYYGITHTDHTVMNPMSLGRTRELVELLALPGGGRILDVACGKAEFLCLAVEACGVTATGIELSPFTFAAAQENVADRGLADRIELLNVDGAGYRPERAGSFDLASCIGASWIYDGHEGTLEALIGMVRPGGLVLVGEPFWKREPDPEYLTMSEVDRESFGTHAGNVRTGVDLGLSFLYAMVSNEDDWDRYEGLQCRAAERYAVDHPEDPDVTALLATAHRNRDAYLRWGRDCLGWAQYLFRKP